MTIDNNPEVLIEKRGNVAIVILNRPEFRNAMGITLSANIVEAIDALESDPDVLAIVLAGAGPTFCSGGKLGEMLGENVDTELRDSANRDAVQLVSRIRNLEIPVICALSGTNVGGGVAIGLACDLVVAAEDAAYLFAFGRVGAAAADMGCSYLLPRIVGSARARHILLAGLRIDAKEGVELGLFVGIVPSGQLLDAAIGYADQIIASSTRAAIAATKKNLLHGETTNFETILYYEHYLQTYFLNSEEHKGRVKKLIADLKRK